MSRREQSYFDRLKKSQEKSIKQKQASSKSRSKSSASSERPKELTKNRVDKAWIAALKSCQYMKYVGRQNATVRRMNKPWKTIRLFVSSTFHDFQVERDILVKKVFPDLRAWCKERKLHLVEIDLR